MIWLIALYSCMKMIETNQSISLLYDQKEVVIMKNNEIKQQFNHNKNDYQCNNPQLYIYEDYNHSQYEIISSNIKIVQIYGQWKQIFYSIVLRISNLCPDGQTAQQINQIRIKLQDQRQLSYLVNCQPNQFYKPFQIGLFILIILCFIITIFSSIYSRSWSYPNLRYDIDGKFIILFNVFIISGTFLAYYAQNFAAISIKIIGSLMGLVCTTICTAQILWLMRSSFLNNKLKRPILSKFRMLDIISLIIAVIILLCYWLINRLWFINNIISICIIVAFIKILKLKSLLTGVLLLGSLLIVEIIGGLFIHYFIGVSYNNIILTSFSSPLFITLPSITHELYRNCAWLPVTSLVSPGLLLSYLRRFDVNRSTWLYLLISSISLSIGSCLWMLVDMLTIHALPFAIISEPFTIISIIIISYRRNQFHTIWKGIFYDKEAQHQTVVSMSNRLSISPSIEIQQYTADLKLDANQRSSNLEQPMI